MKYVCLGYLEPGKFETMSESERNSVLDDCFSYNDELRKNGHLVAEEALQPADTAVIVDWKNGKVAVTDGPYAETKEQLGGLQVIEARDLNHAIQLISQSPGLRLGCGLIEIRPAADLAELMRASEQRRRGSSGSVALAQPEVHDRDHGNSDAEALAVALHEVLERDRQGRDEGEERVIAEHGERQVLFVGGAFAGEWDAGDIDEESVCE